jgi:transcriptional regulator with XRE-family HTH domain
MQRILYSLQTKNMGLRSQWLYLIAQKTNRKIYDVPTLQKYLKRQGIRVRTGTIENLEAIAYHLGVPEAQNIPLELIPKVPRKPRGSIKPCHRKSKLSDREIFDLRKQGETFEAIAALAGVSKQAVSERMRRYRESQL